MQTPCVWFMHVQIILTHSQLGRKDRGAMDEFESIKTAEDFPRGVSRALFCKFFFFSGELPEEMIFRELPADFLLSFEWTSPREMISRTSRPPRGSDWLCILYTYIYILYIYLYMHACMMMLGFMELPGAEASLAAAGCFAGSLECLGAPGPRQPSLVRGKVDGARGHGVHPTSCESSSSAGGRWKMWKWGHVNPKQTQKH